MRCDGCKFAKWKRTSNGRLHPSGDGICTRLEIYPIDLKLPAAFYWGTYGEPKPGGGYIERGRELPENCQFKAADLSRIPPHKRSPMEHERDE